MGRKGKRRRYGEQELPGAPALAGPIIGARILSVGYREEGVIALGADSERWRTTDDINALLASNDEFVAGSSLREIRETLEFMHPSPVRGASMIEICSNRDLKRHTMPFGDSALMTRRRNPNRTSYWGEPFITTWKAEPIEILERLCVGGNDLLISAETETHLREEDDFYGSSLVIGRRDSWYSIVKYNPGKPGARRKTATTITKNAQHAADLITAGRDLRKAAAVTYESLCEELDEFDVRLALGHVTQPTNYSYSHNSYDDKETMAIVRQVKALLVIHAALRGKHAYRYNEPWQAFLEAVRKRPADLGDDTWGNYSDVKEWLAAQCRLRRLPPTRAMLAARAVAEAEAARAAAADVAARTCARCGTVQEHRYDLQYPPALCEAKYAPADRLCQDCWEVESDALSADGLQPAAAEA
jgi:hypothetical protein